MAKREFIDRVEIDKIFYQTKASDELVGTYEKILDIKPITEQDIVKPYLEKALNRIFEDEYIKTHINGDVWERIEDIMDNLLSEQGDKDE